MLELDLIIRERARQKLGPSPTFARRRQVERDLEESPEAPHAMRQADEGLQLEELISAWHAAKDEARGGREELVERWSHELSNHVYWLDNASVEKADFHACQHSRYVNLYASALAEVGHLSEAYKEFVVSHLSARLEQFADKSSIYFKNSRDRLVWIEDLPTAKVELPTWPSPAEAMDAVLALSRFHVFKDVNDVRASVKEARER